jgi:hypothetical protein
MLICDSICKPIRDAPITENEVPPRGRSVESAVLASAWSFDSNQPFKHQLELLLKAAARQAVCGSRGTVGILGFEVVAT